MILLVEDNPDEELLTLRALRQNKIVEKIVVVHDGEEALEFLFCTGAYADRDPQELLKLIILDINLPKMNGLQVLRHLRADSRTRLIPVVLLTASKEEQDLIEGYESGANSFLRKPVDYLQFEDYVGEMGKYWLRLNEGPPG